MEPSTFPRKYGNMNAFLLYHPKTKPTGREIARLMGISSGKHCRFERCASFSHIIRWGNAEEIQRLYSTPGKTLRFRTEINDRAAVALASSKFRALRAMQAAGVPVPRAARVSEEAIFEGRAGLNYPIFARRFHHCRGQDIVILRERTTTLFPASFRGPHYRPDYYVEYVKPAKEYRIHVFRGTIIIAQKKFFSESYLARQHPEPEIRDEAEFIRNDEHGWRFYEVKDFNNVPEAVRNASISAVDALGLDFGAVDVISYGRDENGKRKAAVLEVNTAPGLMEANEQIYVQNLRSYLETLAD